MFEWGVGKREEEGGCYALVYSVFGDVDKEEGEHAEPVSWVVISGKMGRY